MSCPTQAHLYVTQIKSPRFHFIGIVELIICLKCLKTSLKIENFEMKLKFENFELGFSKLNFEIKNLSFINLRLRNL